MVERTADNRIRTTEWEDIQYKHGNAVGQYRTHELEIQAQKVLDEHPDALLRPYDPTTERVHDKAERGGFDTADGGVPDGSGTEDEEDDILASYRARRREQMVEQQRLGATGRVFRADAASYVPEITEASAEKWVLALLTVEGNANCDSLLKIWEQLAPRQTKVKFVRINATDAIKNFPNKQAPTVLAYYTKKVAHSIVGIEQWGGKNLSLATAERLMLGLGILLPEGSDHDGSEDDEAARGGKQYSRFSS